MNGYSQFIWTVTVRVFGSLISLFFATQEIFLWFISLPSLQSHVWLLVISGRIMEQNRYPVLQIS